MQIIPVENPFGGIINMQFLRKHHCILSVDALNPIKVNTVQMMFSKSFAVIDGEWKMVNFHEDSGAPFHNSFLSVRFHDWNRNGTPSAVAIEKISKWIESFFIPALNLGTYTTQQNQAEREQVQRERFQHLQKIVDARKIIDESTIMVETLTRQLETMPI